MSNSKPSKIEQVKTETNNEHTHDDDSSSSSSSSSLSPPSISSSELSSDCVMIISEVIAGHFLNGENCTLCTRSIKTHRQHRSVESSINANAASSFDSVSSSSKSLLDKNVLHQLPKWKTDYKSCTPFFKRLERLFVTHNVNNTKLFAKYLQETLNDISDADQMFAFDNITNKSPSPSWDTIKTLFIERFESFDYVNKLVKQYEEIKYFTHDNIQSFSSRYINLCTELNYDVNSLQTIRHFLGRLPSAMHQRFLIKIDTQEKTLASFTSLSEIVIHITKTENAFHNAVSASSESPNIDNHSNTNSNKHKKNPRNDSTNTVVKKCVYHPNSTAHTTSECSLNTKDQNSNVNNNNKNTSVNISTGSNNATATNTGISSYFCTYCRRPGHTEDRCRTKQNAMNSSSSSSSSSSASSSSQGQVRSFAPHYSGDANTRTRSQYAASGTTPTTYNNNIKSVSTTVESESDSDSSSSSSYDVDFKTVDITMPSQLCSLSMRAHPTLLVIYVKGQRFYGLPDTGASSSCLDPRIPEQFGFDIIPVNGYFNLADVSIRPKRIGKCEFDAAIVIPGSDDQIKLTHSFEILPIFEQDKGYHFLIGRDILGPLFPNGLPALLFMPESNAVLPRFHHSSSKSKQSQRSAKPSAKSFVTESLSPSPCINRIDIIDHHDIVHISINQVAVVEKELKSFENDIYADLQALASDIHDLGAGVVPSIEIPVRPSVLSESPSSVVTASTSASSTSFDLSSTTPAEIKQKYSSKLNTLLVMLCANEAITGFCTLPGCQVELIIDESKKHLLFRRQYPIANTLMSLTDKVIERWFETGKIMLAPVGCQFNLPLTIAPKKDDDGKLTGIRLCLDTRILNAILLSTDKFTIPQIRDTISLFAGCALFGEFDLSEAYLQFPLHPNSRQYTAFTWRNVQYMFVGVPFGISYISSHFQRQLSVLFNDLSFTMPYFDNLPFGSKSWNEHLDHAITIVDRLNKVNLKIKPSSVKIGRTSMKCLGHILSTAGIGIDPDKVQSILAHPYPPTGDNMMVFLGETGYISAHVRNYAELSAPFQAVKFQKTIEWTDSMKTQFDLLKQAVASAPFLQFPDFSLPFHIATDASNTGVGGVLYQIRKAGEHVTADNIVAIFSKVLTECQRRYPAYKKELLGIVLCLRRFHSYVWGRNDLVIVTDHKPLTYMFESKTLSPSLQQWYDVIADYTFKIEHRDGILHVFPDALSRIYTDVYTSPTWGVETTSLASIAGVNEDTVSSSFPVEKHEKRISRAASSSPLLVNDIHVKTLTTRAKHRISDHLATRSSISSNSSSSSTAPAISDFSSKSPIPLSSPRLELPLTSAGLKSAGKDLAYTNHANSNNNNKNSITDFSKFDHNLLYDNNENNENSDIGNYNDAEADHDNNIDLLDIDHRSDIDLAIELEKRGKTIIHDVNQRRELIDQTHQFGHFGVSAIFNKLWHQGYWWSRMRPEIQEVLIDCDPCTRFNTTKSGYHPLKPITALGPGDHFQMDLSTHLPPSTDGYTTLLAVIDVYTGFVILRAMRDSGMETVAKELWDIFCLIGWPRILQSDNGREFVNQVIQVLNKITGIDHRLISAYNPRADGKVERVIGSTMMIIKKLLHGANHNWSLYVPFAQVTFNDKVASLTGSSPFALMFGRSLNELKDYTQGVDPVPIPLTDWKEHQNKILSVIYPALSDRIKGAKDKQTTIWSKHRRMLLPASIKPGSTVMIKDPIRANKFEPKYIGPYIIVRRTYNGAYELKDVTGSLLDRHVPIDQIKIVSKTARLKDVNTFTVQKVLDHRDTNTSGVFEYLVQWRGYDDEDNEWIHQSGFNDTACLDKYWKSLKSSQQ